MAQNKSVRVSLSPQLAAFLEAQVSTGQYDSAQEVVCESLRLMEARSVVRSAALRGVKRKIAVGLAQARRGELHDGPAFMQSLSRSLKTRGKRSAAP